MNERWLIIADDLTGAADAGIAFARRGWNSQVIWGAANIPAEAGICAFDADSRALDAADAAGRHREAALRLLAPGWQLYKKIDSTLRGHPAAEIAALLAALRELGRPANALVAPANPAAGRTLLDGRVHVHGRPLDELPEWTHAGVKSADLASLLSAAGLRVVKLPLSRVRGAPEALRNELRAAAAGGDGTLALCDAETDDDLERIVAAARDAGGFGLCVGSGGLAQALAAHRRVPVDLPTLPFTPRGTLVAVGTRAAVSQAAAAEVARHVGKAAPVYIDVDDSTLVHGPSQALFVLSLQARMYRGEVLVAQLRVPGPAEPSNERELCRRFAYALLPSLYTMGALIVTGGETAAVMLDLCKVHGIRLLGELEPGIALGMTCGDVEVPIVTKPGAFGDAHSLVRCLEKIRTLRCSP